MTGYGLAHVSSKSCRSFGDQEEEESIRNTLSVIYSKSMEVSRFVLYIRSHRFDDDEYCGSKYFYQKLRIGKNILWCHYGSYVA